MKTLLAAFWLLTILLVTTPAFSGPEDERERRIEQLEKTVQTLMEEIDALKESEPDEIRELEPGDLEDRIRALEKKSDAVGRIRLGGYGESHLTFGEGSTNDVLDYHRFVLYLGYDFADWIRLHSETELEHAYVADDSGGEISIEQLHIDFLLSDSVNVRFGRVLTPIGITNAKHEPPSFNGVERPFFDRFIVPTTWSSDGVGLFGSIGETVSYEIYAVAGMDGSGFSAVNGIRGGRIKERPSLSHPAVTGRVDFFPFAERNVTAGQTLRIGVSGWYGGIDNGNRGNDPGVGNTLGVVSGDFEYTISAFDFRGALAWESIDGAREIGDGVASAIFGWYVEAAAHVLPDSLKTGKLAAGDLVVFVRYEDYDTQYRMPKGISDDSRGDRTAITIGATFFLRPNLVLKADYQILDDQTGDDLDDLFNLGVGWQF
jgi:hypothetical protein